MLAPLHWFSSRPQLRPQRRAFVYAAFNRARTTVVADESTQESVAAASGASRSLSRDGSFRLALVHHCIENFPCQYGIRGILQMTVFR